MSDSEASDKSLIDDLIQKFFAIFDNKNNHQHDWDLIYRICIPETTIIRKNGFGQTVYDLKNFIEPRKIILSDGTLTEFEEFEIEEQTIINTNIAQRRSRYQKNGYLENQFFSELGTKFFNLVRTEKGWKISAVLWEDDKA